MVDRTNRERLADALDRYLEGDMDNFALDDSLGLDEIAGSMDTAISEIAWALWFFYDDVTRRRNIGRHKLAQKHEVIIRRWISFLRTAEEWPIAPCEEFVGKPISGENMRWWTILGRGIFNLVTPPYAFSPPPFASNEYWPFKCAVDWDPYCQPK